MNANINARRNNDSTDNTPSLATAFVPHKVEEAKAASDEERMHIFWRVFGGTLVSICALAFITVYNNISGSISELRAEIIRINDARSDLIKKDEFNTRLSTNYERIQTAMGTISAMNTTLTGMRSEIDGLKERVAKQTTDFDSSRKELASLDIVKEKLSAMTVDLKGVRDEAGKLRDEAGKLRQDMDKNLAADNERKTRRDEQAKELDKALKDLMNIVTDCQVKVARLEGSQGPTPASKTPVKNSTRSIPNKTDLDSKGNEKAPAPKGETEDKDD